MKNAFNKWVFALLLSLPVLFFFLMHFFNHAPGIIPTGFIQYDNVTYVGNAREYLQPGHQGLFYHNRLNDSDNYPNIYVQPQHFLLVLFMKMGLPPGISLCIFVYLFSVIFFRILIEVFDEIYPRCKNRNLILVLFSWGGGLLTLCGWLLYFFHQTNGQNFFGSGLFLDPASGWWGLNLGRSLIFSMEAFYHVLFFASILMIIRKKFIAATVFAVLLSISHPFTGLEFLLIVLTWTAIEKVFFANKNIPWAFVTAIAVIICFHGWYYLLFLNSFPEHHSVFGQYQLNWRLRFFQFIPAYLLVAVLCIQSIRHSRIHIYFRNENNRLFVCWAMVAFLLANHELFFRPVQPLHFTRGYIWSALFLAGISALDILLNKLKPLKFAPVIISIVVTAFLLDNINWMFLNTRYDGKPNMATYIDEEQQKILFFIKAEASPQTLVISSDEILPYLSTVYSNAYSWISHEYNTPFYELKKQEYNEYLLTGKQPSAWLRRDLLFIAGKKNTSEMSRYTAQQASVKNVFETKNYILYRENNTSIK